MASSVTRLAVAIFAILFNVSFLQAFAAADFTDASELSPTKSQEKAGASKREDNAISLSESSTKQSPPTGKNRRRAAKKPGKNRRRAAKKPGKLGAVILRVKNLEAQNQKQEARIKQLEKLVASLMPTTTTTTQAPTTTQPPTPMPANKNEACEGKAPGEKCWHNYDDKFTEGYCYLPNIGSKAWCRDNYTPPNGPKERACKGKEMKSKCAFTDPKIRRDVSGICYKTVTGFAHFFCRETPDSYPAVKACKDSKPWGSCRIKTRNNDVGRCKEHVWPWPEKKPYWMCQHLGSDYQACKDGKENSACSFLRGNGASKKTWTGKCAWHVSKTSTGAAMPKMLRCRGAPQRGGSR